MDAEFQVRPGKRISSNSLSPSTSKAIMTAQKKRKTATGNVLVKPPRSRNLSQKKNHVTDAHVTNNPSSPTQKAEIQTHEKPVKPIFVESNFQVISNYISAMQFLSKPMIKINAKHVQVICRTNEDKMKIIQMLKEKVLKYWTFTEPEDKSTIFVLRGYFKTDPANLLASLVDEGIDVKAVTFLKDNDDFPEYLIHFEKNKIQLNTLMHVHKSIGCIIVRWSTLDKARKRPTQCHRCQSWGHSARNCGKDFRCVKCTEQHAPGKDNCNRKSRDGTAKCVNCNGDHPANSRQCPAYLKYQEKISKKNSTEPKQFVASPAPWRNNNQTQYQQNFPPLAGASKVQQRLVWAQECESEENFEMDSNCNNDEKESVSFTNSTSSKSFPKSRRNSVNNSFTKTQSAFMAIPDIETTLSLFSELTNKLSECHDHGERLRIMIQYTAPRPINNAN